MKWKVEHRLLTTATRCCSKRGENSTGLLKVSFRRRACPAGVHSIFREAIDRLIVDGYWTVLPISSECPKRNQILHRNDEPRQRFGKDQIMQTSYITALHKLSSTSIHHLFQRNQFLSTSRMNSHTTIEIRLRSTHLDRNPKSLQHLSTSQSQNM